MTSVEIDRDSHEARLIIDTRFYGYGAVFQAAADYSETCWVLVDGDKEKELLVTIKPKLEEIDVEKVGYEFYNYLLGLMHYAITTI